MNKFYLLTFAGVLALVGCEKTTVTPAGAPGKDTTIIVPAAEKKTETTTIVAPAPAAETKTETTETKTETKTP